MKKCNVTNKSKLRNKRNNKRCSSAGMFYTSSAGAVTSLIFAEKKCISAVISLILVSLFSIFLSLFGLTSTTSTYADSITLSVDTNNLAVNMVPTTSTGDFAQSGNMNISVSTDNSSGYTLSIASSTGSTDLKSGSNTISSIASAIDQNTFSTNTNYNNQWGYKPSYVYDSSTEQNIANTSFRPLPGTTGEIIAKTTSANSTIDTYSLSIGAKVNNTTPIGDYASDSFIITAVPNFVGLTINYDANGGYFGSNTSNTTNTVIYDATSASGTCPSTTTETKYSHTSNINDSGVASGDYANNLNTNQVITISGATKLHIVLTYQTESTSYDWVSFWAGNYPSYTAGSNYGSGVQWSGTGSTGGKYGGTTKTTLEGDIDGDTVTFGFKSDGSVTNYGYYAVITGYIPTTVPCTTYSKTVYSGTYDTPSSSDGTVFAGWATSPTGSVEYKDESEISANLESVNDDPDVTLYAVWKPPYSYIQDYTKATCQAEASSGDITVIDARDENTYTVRYINGNCWMTQNLRFKGTSLSTGMSDVTSNKTVAYYDLEGAEATSSSGKCYQDYNGSSGTGTGNSYSNACIHDSGNSTFGVYYNYAAASAMSITGNSNYTEASQSVCPANWKMPSNSQISGLASYINIFNPVSSGSYWGGSYDADWTAYWSSTAYTSATRYSRRWIESNSSFGNVYSPRGGGYSLRCIRSS